MLILFICLILAVVALVCYSVRYLVAEAFSGTDWLKFTEYECSDEGHSSYMENPEFEYGHDVEHRTKEEI